MTKSRSHFNTNNLNAVLDYGPIYEVNCGGWETLPDVRDPLGKQSTLLASAETKDITCVQHDVVDINWQQQSLENILLTDFKHKHTKAHKNNNFVTGVFNFYF